MAKPIRFRTVLAFLVGPISVGLLFLVSLPFLTSPSEGLYGLFFSAIIGYPVAILFGIPTFILFNRLKWTGLFPYALAAAAYSAILIGAFIVTPVLSAPHSAADQLTSGTRLTQMAYLTIAVASSVLAFWLIARPDRAVRTQKNP